MSPEPTQVGIDLVHNLGRVLAAYRKVGASRIGSGEFVSQLRCQLHRPSAAITSAGLILAIGAHAIVGANVAGIGKAVAKSDNPGEVRLGKTGRDCQRKAQDEQEGR